MKAVVFNLGCKTNRYESDAMMAELASAGIQVTDRLEPADFCIINTCAVTAEAEKKSRQAVARAKSAGINAVYVCGCGSEHQKDAYLTKNGVRYVIGNHGKNKLVKDILSGKFTGCNSVQNIFTKNSSSADKNIDKSTLSEDNNIAKNSLSADNCNLDYEEFLFKPLVSRARATLKIQDGCNNFCSYCIIPYLRGRSRSRDKQSVIREAEQLSQSAKELVLTGINLSQYGVDKGETLAELITALSHIDTRIRLGSFYVEGVTDALLSALKGLKQFCPQFHLSLQSGDDQVLSAMNRKYVTFDYLNAVKKIRDIFPNAGITTDIITGFPGETEENALNTEYFLREVGFSDIHVFVYSKREGTSAAKREQVADAVKNQRKARLLALKAELTKTFLQNNIGIEQTVLIEEKAGEEWVGYSGNYIRVYSEREEVVQKIAPTKLYKDGLK